MKDFKLNADGDLMDGRLCADYEQVAQAVKIALQRFRGEWRLDKTDGRPWLNVNKHISKDVVVLVYQGIMSVAGVTSAQIDDIKLDGERRATVTATINGNPTTITI